MKILVHYLAFNSNQSFEFPSSLVGSSASFESVLEIIFRACNVVDGTEWIVQESKKRIQSGGKGLRSMSVGDMITFVDEGKWVSYMCEGIGWKKLN